MSFPLAFILLLFVGIVAMVFLSAAFGRAYSSYKLKLKQKMRKGLNKEEFIDFFLKMGYEQQTVSYLYTKIIAGLPKKFTPHPDDNLSGDYQFHKDYLNFLAIDVFRKAQGRAPGIEEEKYLQQKKSTDTFEKIVKFAEKKNA